LCFYQKIWQVLDIFLEVSYKTDVAVLTARGTALTATIADAKITVDNTYGYATLTWTGTDNPAITNVEGSNSSEWSFVPKTTMATNNFEFTASTGAVDAGYTLTLVAPAVPPTLII
jgi:hypothetical protein